MEYCGQREQSLVHPLEMAKILSSYYKEFQSQLVMSSTQAAIFIPDLKAVKLD